jgi:hypothetical protein
MKSIFDLCQYEAVIVVHGAERPHGKPDQDPEVLATIPFHCQYDEREEFDQSLASAVEGLERAYAHHPDGYLTISVIRRHGYINMS